MRAYLAVTTCLAVVWAGAPFALAQASSHPSARPRSVHAGPVTALAQAGSATMGAAFARRGANACSWVIGTDGIEKTLPFAQGSYTLSSFRNTLVRPTREYVTADSVSSEFRFVWDGTMLTGASGGWTCRSGRASS